MSIKQAPLADSLEWQENSENVSKEGYGNHFNLKTCISLYFGV